MDELHERASELDIKGRSSMSAEELRQAIADHDAAVERAAELNIRGRTKMTNPDLLEAIAAAEAKAAGDEAGDDVLSKGDEDFAADPEDLDPSERAAKARVEAPMVPGEQHPFTSPIPQTGEGDMTYSPAPDNLPSVPGVELPSSVHKHSGGKVVLTRQPVEAEG